jgi:DnaJ-domain-containing protein 1
MLSLLCTLMAPIAAFAVGIGPQVDRPDAEVPTVIERALMERACIATETVSAESHAHQRCLDAKLLSLRSDFGRDLSQLSAPDRRRIDAACSRLRASDQREAYLDCLSAQLTIVHNRQNRGKTPIPEEAVVASGTTPESAALAASQQTPQASSWVVALVGGSAAGLLIVGGVAFVALKSRRTTHPCRVCGVVVADSDLCPTCRHEAAEVLRRAAGERAQTQKALEEEERRQRESEAEEREKKARDEEEARLRELEVARQRQEGEELQRQVHATVGVAAAPSASAEETDVFDPYVVLGVPSEAGPDAIRAAYQQAMTRFDPQLVEFLGDEAQAHFKTKAQSIERAYHMLSGAQP